MLLCLFFFFFLHWVAFNISMWPKQPILRSTEYTQILIVPWHKEFKLNKKISPWKKSPQMIQGCVIWHIYCSGSLPKPFNIYLSQLCNNPYFYAFKFFRFHWENFNGNLFQYKNNGMLLDVWNVFPLSEIWSTDDKNSNLLSALMKSTCPRTLGMYDLILPCSCKTWKLV